MRLISELPTVTHQLKLICIAVRRLKNSLFIVTKINDAFQQAKLKMNRFQKIIPESSDSGHNQKSHDTAVPVVNPQNSFTKIALYKR
jgi:hypothetical protein